MLVPGSVSWKIGYCSCFRNSSSLKYLFELLCDFLHHNINFYLSLTIRKCQTHRTYNTNRDEHEKYLKSPPSTYIHMLIVSKPSWIVVGPPTMGLNTCGFGHCWPNRKITTHTQTHRHTHTHIKKHPTALRISKDPPMQ